ncbi:MAG TPA: hypothetical protein VFV27_08890 [Nevskiaceae bacterium]|nr:hypothetical protein [Nevskiaceae bacterium]
MNAPSPMNRLLRGLRRSPALAVGSALLIGVLELRALQQARRRSLPAVSRRAA